MLPYTVKMVKENLLRVRKSIEAAATRAGRNPNEIRLVVVTKEAGLDAVRQIIDAGVVDIGENRVKEASIKKRLLDAHVLNWHMIGHLQTNKVKEAVKLFSLIQSVDSIRLTHIIDREAKKANKTQDVLLEINVSGEESKYGINPKNLKNFLKESGTLKHVKVLGLMTMAPFTDNPEKSRPYFRRLKELSKVHGLRELSMGMTQDFEVAIEEGATMVRVGSAIFRA